eukprot:gnl/TRDRNA2_/TRDRNA2_83926_c0_seq2.p1 gnl/TRDRNA2_/TRDRNA2_83926_c0~~gnl/TRDRNA2_/TRDRNA2_83926_c0_seq2.p1  ORF type:complete len:380 (+),score=52.90 gnl/TRDRNA2_/TRDRNA2_83926_c0_seq2:46-1185(+)
MASPLKKMALESLSAGGPLPSNRKVENDVGAAVRLVGAPGSPYSNKILFYLRYRRIPYRWINMNHPEAAGTAEAPGPILLPKVIWPDGTVQNDSSFLIQRFEREHAGRSCYPQHRGLAFLGEVLEDFADEWLTKCMFHFRWIHDPLWASTGIAHHQSSLWSAPAENVERMAAFIRERQVSRLSVVGSNATTGAVIEAFYKGFLAKLDAHFAAGYPFLLGTRPSAADFAVLGQLHPMILLDRETSALTRAHSQRVCSWYASAQDLSGYSVADESAGWIDPAKELPPTLKAIFQDVGRLYVPFLLANASALKSGKEAFSVKLDGGTVLWEQPTFKYQAKCLGWLREAFQSMSAADQRWVLTAVAGTGTEVLVSDGPAAAKL